MSARVRRRADGVWGAGGRARLPSGGMPQVLDIVSRPLEGAPCIALRGELDIADVPRVERELDAAIAATAGAFLVDLCALEFLDSSGIRTLLRARALLAREDRTLALVCPPGPALRPLELAGVADLFTIYTGREDAARALVPARASRSGGAPRG
jgi:anti-sigma B factor antagonist